MSLPGTQNTATNWTGVGYGIVLGFVAAYFQFKVPPVLPVLLDTYDYDRFVAGGFMSIFAVAGMVVSVRVGHAIRRHGAVRYLAAAFSLMIAGSLLGLAAPESGGVMLISRTIEGLGAAVLAVCMPAFANMNAGPRHLPIIIAVQATWIPIGQVSANLIAQPAVAAGQWQPVWWAGIIATVAVAVWTFAIVRQGRVDFGGRSTNNISQSRANTTPSAERRALLLAAVLFFLWQAQFMAFFTWLPVYLVEVRGLTADGAVLINQIPVIVLLVFALATGFVLRAGVGTIPLLLTALLLQAASWLLVPVADSATVGTISLIAWGIAAGITPTCLWALPSVLLGGHRADTHAFAVVLTGRYLGILAGPLIAVAIFRLTGDWLAVAYTFGAITAFCAAAAFYLGVLVRRFG
ncbi:MAG: MFS transporter [Alphaproteobacteria bacterium]|nr:MFS transporter [Alphaproteobacteria bacterium]